MAAAPESSLDEGRPKPSQSAGSMSEPTISAKPKQSIKQRIVAIWKKIGLNSRQVKIMFKGAWPPVIALALYQYDAYELTFPTLGYLVAIASILSLSFTPRAKFVQGMIFNILGVAVGVGIALLSCFSAVQARAHTSDPKTQANIGASGARQATDYNASASTVAGVFLFFNIMIANAVRFARPQLQLPIILYSIFANVAGTFAPTFSSMASVYVFIKQLSTAFLSGFGIATVCHFVIFPYSSRDVVVAEFKGYFATLQKVLSAQREYLQSMESAQMLDASPEHDGSSRFERASKGVKGAIGGLSALHAKIQADLPFAKREVAWGYIRPKEFSVIFTKLRAIYLPLIGLSSIVDIYERLVYQREWNTAPRDSPQYVTIREEITEWNEIMQALHDPFEHVINGISQGLEHITYCLKLAKQPNRSEDDPEADPSAIKPGDRQFGRHLEQISEGFWNRRAEALKIWCMQKRIPFQDYNPDREVHETLDHRLTRIFSHDHARQQLYMILYMEYLLHSVVRAVLEMIQEADRLVEDGTMSRRRFIVPGRKRTMKWLKNAFKVEDGTNDHTLDSYEEKMYTVDLGDAFKKKRNPEHLPPRNAFERFGEVILNIVSVLRSDELAFGFRVACATMSIGIMAFLQQTQAFFIEQRLVWAMIMIAISMTMTSGSGVFGFLARVGGTFIAMCSSLVIWYIAGGRGVPVGVLILLWCVIFCILGALMITSPRYTPVAMITMVTHCLILGYELQVDKAGIATQISSGQVYYPIYLLGPYRLATVAAGCAVAFFWTYFPYPMTAGSILRRQIGEALYLMSNYYSVVHHTIWTRLNSSGGDPNDKNSPIALLDRTRTKLLGKLLAMNVGMQGHISFVPLEFSFGGKFPLEEYKALVKSINSLRDYIALLSYSTRDYLHDPRGENVQWLEDLAKMTAHARPTSHEITKLLVMLSSAVLDGQPLVPYLSAPPAFRMAQILAEMDPDILSAKHFLEPGYASFAVTQVASKLIADDLCNLLKHIKNLVGEVDFSFHIISTATQSETTLSSTGEKKGKAD